MKKPKDLKMLVHWVCPPLLLGNPLPPAYGRMRAQGVLELSAFHIILANVPNEAECIQLRSILDQVSAELT